jgi:hypothetical protein
MSKTGKLLRCCCLFLPRFTPTKTHKDQRKEFAHCYTHSDQTFQTEKETEQLGSAMQLPDLIARTQHGQPRICETGHIVTHCLYEMLLHGTKIMYYAMGNCTFQAAYSAALASKRSKLSSMEGWERGGDCAFIAFSHLAIWPPFSLLL